jgi:hypothetical protein
MEITLQYFDVCPNWRITDAHLSSLIAEGLDASVTYQIIDRQESAVEHGFRGSPTVLIDGEDPFADPGAPVGLTCRIYDSGSGPAGSPTLEQLRAVTAAREET